MAARVNTRFVLILLVTVVAVAGILGGLVYLKVKNNTERHISLGDELMASAEYEDAMSAYGRAVAKQPANLGHLAKYEEALRARRPANREEANELYAKSVQIMAQRVRYHGNEARFHKAFIDELLYKARLTNAEIFWHQMAEAAGEMWTQTDPADPARDEASLYRGLAAFRLVMIEPAEELDTPVERLGIMAEVQAEDDVLQYLQKNGESDFGWATLVLGQVAIGERFRNAGSETQARHWMDKAGESVDAALKAAPDGAEVSRAVALYRGLKLASDSGAMPVEQLEQSIARMIELVGASDDPALTYEAAELLRSLLTRETIAQSIALLKAYVGRHPDARFHRTVLVQVQVLNGDLDEAEANAEKVANREELPVGFLSKYQDQLEKRCRGMLVDIAYKRWEQAEDDEAADRNALLAELERRMKAFEKLVTDPVNDPLYQLAEGKLAMAHEDCHTAAAKFDGLRRSTANPGTEVLVYAAKSLECTGAKGVAYECVQTLQRLQPRSTLYLYECARLAYALRQMPEASAWLDKLMEEDPQHDLGRRLHKLLVLEESGGGTPADQLDPVTQALVEANNAMKQGDQPSARATLEEVLAGDPDNLQILDALLQVELSGGEPGRALGYVDRLITLQPDNPRLRQLKVTLENDDPFEAVAQYVGSLENLDEAQRSVAMLLNYSALAVGQRLAARRYTAAGKTEDAAAALGRADRAEQEAARWEAEAIRLAEDSPQLIEYRLQRATAAKDWTAAEKLLEQARRTNADQAAGSLFAGQIAAARGRYEEAILLIDEATTRIPHSSIAWRSLAMACERTGNFGRAKDAYANAYHNNPNDIETAQLYVSLLIRSGDDARALRVLRRAHRVVPNSITLREAWLRQEEKVGDRAMVLKLRRELYRQNPDDAVNAEQLATFLARIDPDRTLILDESGEPRFPEGRWLRKSSVEKAALVADERRQWHAECDTIVAALGDDDDGALEPVVLRALLQKERGLIDAGEKTLADFAARDPGDVKALLALGRYQFNVGRVERAEATMKRATAVQDPEAREADLALGELYALAGNNAKAVESLQRATEVNSDHDAVLRLIECHTNLGQFREAQKLLAARMQAGHDGFQEQMLLADIADNWAHEMLLDGNDAGAAPLIAQRDQAWLKAEQLGPSSPEPHVQRAVAALRAFSRERAKAPAAELENVIAASSHPGEALRSLARADEVRAGYLQTSLTRVRVLTARGDVDGAIGELRRIVERAPDETAARDRLARLQYAQGDLDSAIQTIEKGIDRNPTLAAWPELQGDLYLTELRRRRAAGEPTDDLDRKAVEAYKAAVNLKPDPAQVSKLAQAYEALDPPDYRSVEQLLGGAQQQLAADPALRAGYALSLHRLGRKDEALQQMRQAYVQFKGEASPQWQRLSSIGFWYRTMQKITSDPGEIESFVNSVAGSSVDEVDLRWIARCWAMNRDGLSRAMEIHQSAIERHAGRDPKVESELYYDLARYYIHGQQFPAAVEALERVLDLDPDHKQALNNCCYLVATTLGKPRDAIPFADRLEKLISIRDDRGERATYYDTIGWVYYLTDQKDRAEDYLRKSRATNESPTCLMHLARLLADRGDYRSAESHLQRAAELKPDPGTEAEIKAVWDDIRTRKAQGQ